jgi:hypothetical protein
MGARPGHYMYMYVYMYPTYQDGISYEEDGSIIADQVPVTILCVEFDGKSTRVTHSVSTARLTAYMYMYIIYMYMHACTGTCHGTV